MFVIRLKLFNYFKLYRFYRTYQLILYDTERVLLLWEQFLLLFCPKFYRILKENLRLEWVRFLPEVCQLRLREKRCWRCFHHILVNSAQNATGTVWFLKMFEIWFFWKNRWVFFRKKSLEVFKVAKCGNFFPEFVLNGKI